MQPTHDFTRQEGNAKVDGDLRAPFEPHPTSERARRSHSTIVCLLLALITLWVYLPVRHHGFVSFDDPEYVTANPMVQQGLTWAGVKWAFTTGYFSYWHPLTWLSHMLDVQVFGKSPAGPHLVNVLLHLANTVLLFVVLRRFTGALWRSAFVAALFALHPLHVESVAWVAERKDVLSALFFLLTLWAYERWTRDQRPMTNDQRLKTRDQRQENAAPRSLVSGPWSLVSQPWYACALLLFACGLMSKPMVVTLPFVLLLLDYWPLRRVCSPAFRRNPTTSNLPPEGGTTNTVASLIAEKLPFFLLTAIACVVTFIAQRQNDAVQTLSRISMSDRIENAFVSYARYLGKTIWPADLAFFYPRPGGWSTTSVVLAALLLTALTIGVLWLGGRLRFASMGWFLFLGMLVPTIGLVQVGDQSIADRYTYLPLVGVFIILAWGAPEVFSRWRWSRVMMGIAAGLAVVACAARTRDQLRHWRNSESLFRHALAVTERNYMAHNNLGNVLLPAGKIDEAIAHYEKALEIRPDSVNPLNNLGTALLRKGRLHQAIVRFQRALEIQPDLAVARHALCGALLQTGRAKEAIPHLQAIVRSEPTSTEARYDLAIALFQNGRTDEAITHFQKVADLEPRNAEIQNNLGSALLQIGRIDEAIARFQTALKLQPDVATVHANLAAALLRKGNDSDPRTPSQPP